MTYTQLMQAARSENKDTRERARKHFILRLTSKRYEERLTAIERDVLGRMFNMNPHHVFELWREGLPL